MPPVGCPAHTPDRSFLTFCLPVPEPVADASPSNEVTRLYEPAQGRDWVANHWDDFVAIHAEDVVVESRSREGQRYLAIGIDNAMAEARSLTDVGLPHITMEPLAVRGDRLALIRWVNWADETEHGGGPATVEEIGLVEANGDGKVCVVTIFDPDDMDLALTELESRATGSAG